MFQKANKYRNVKTEYDGIKFDSKFEAEYYARLKLKQRGGLIKRFELQVKFPFVQNNIKICTYVADFVVYHNDGTIEVVDTKGFETPEFKIKKKMMLAFYNINISLVKK